jgi:hypothetical protein
MDGNSEILERGIAAARALPLERQDAAGLILLELAAAEAAAFPLSAEQIADLKISVAQADRGELASNEEMAETWKSFGL